MKLTHRRVVMATVMVLTSLGAAGASATTESPVTPTTGVPPSVVVGSASSSASPTTGPTGASSTPASAAPSTTVVAAAALDAAISEAAVQAAAAARAALFRRDDPAATASLDEWYVAGSPARARVDRLVQEHTSASRVLQPHPSISDTTTVEDVMPGAGASPTRAGVVVCSVDASEEVSTSGEQLSQQVTSRRDVYEMNLVDGRWQLLTSSNLQTWSSQAECAPPTDDVIQAAEITVRISEIDAVQVSVVVNPDDPAADDLLRSVYTNAGESIVGTRAFVEGMRDNGQALRVEPGRPPAVTVERLSTPDDVGWSRLEATVCAIDPTVLFEPGTGPNGEDAIVDDLIYAYRETWYLVAEGGGWKVDSIETVGQWTGDVECPAA